MSSPMKIFLKGGQRAIVLDIASIHRMCSPAICFVPFVFGEMKVVEASELIAGNATNSYSLRIRDVAST